MIQVQSRLLFSTASGGACESEPLLGGEADMQRGLWSQVHHLLRIILIRLWALGGFYLSSW